MTIEEATEIARNLKSGKNPLPFQSIEEVRPGRFFAVFDYFDSPAMTTLETHLKKAGASLLQYSNANNAVKIIFMRSGKYE